MTFRKLLPVCWGLAAFYLFVTVAHAGVMSGRERGILMGLAFGSSLFYAALGRLLAKGKVAERWAHPVGLVVCVVPLLNSLTHLAVARDPEQSTNVMLVLLGGGALLLALRWWLVLSFIALAGWVGCMAIAQPDPAEWLHFGFAVAFAVFLSGLMTRVLRDLTLETEIRFRELAHSIRDVFWIAEPGLRRFLYLSPAYPEVWGRGAEELMTQANQYLDYIDAEDRGRVIAAIAEQAAGNPTQLEFRIRRQDGATRWVEDRAYPVLGPHGRVIQVHGVTRDITDARATQAETQAMERRLLASQKLESLGVLAGGIAHDFNNLLTVILGSSNLARLELVRGSGVDQHLAQIEKASKQASDLCRQMLAYAGKSGIQARPLRLETLLNEISELVRASVPKQIELVFEPTRELPAVLGDASQLQQVMLNLIVNAAEAIGNRHGRIDVRTFLTEADGKTFEGAFGANHPVPGAYVAFSVTDTGSGMDAETIQRVFDPFFSTKFAGRGLGLAVVLGIVHSHHGVITVSSKVGLGSTFTVLLPCSDRPVTPSPDRGSVMPAATVPWKGSGTVLVVDDEPEVRQTLMAALRSLGFGTAEAADGEEALRTIRDRGPAAFRVVLLDLTMPRMNGGQTLVEIHGAWPQLPVVLITGYDATHADRLLQGVVPAGRLAKPCTLEALRSVMRSILGPPDLQSSSRA
ncbi:MAG: response regulator [Verrucomicrobiales bacterium]|nr:response regulator [Verrucomicrobiales bacterium]